MRIRRAHKIAAVTLLAILVVASHAVGAEGFVPPAIALDSRLRTIFAVTDCTYISGLTCKIHYNGSAPLPSEVFFVELDAAGKAIGKRTRLIYPHLQKGESGWATFRIQSGSPARISLEASGTGPWKNPY